MRFVFLVFANLLATANVGYGQSESTTREPAQVFFKAIEALQAGDFKTAQSDFTSLLDTKIESGSLYYNLGIAYFRDEQLGKAIYHFRKAKELLPRDADVEFNLEYSRKQTTDKIEAKANKIPDFILNQYPLNIRESLYTLCLIVVLLTISSVLLLFKKNDWLRWTQRGILVLFILAGCGYLLKLIYDQPFGVVAVKQAKVYSGQDKGSVLLFSIHEGAEFRIHKDEAGYWLRVSLADGKKGWIRKTDIIF